MNTQELLGPEYRWRISGHKVEYRKVTWDKGDWQTAYFTAEEMADKIKSGNLVRDT